MIFITLLLFIALLIIAIIIRNRMIIYNTIFLSGILCMVVSQALYMQSRTNVSAPYKSINGILLDPLKALFNPTISQIREISLVGECIIFLLFVVISGNTLKRVSGHSLKMSAFFYSVSVIALLVYVICSLPEVLFRVYLQINSGEPMQTNAMKTLLAVMINAKYAVIIYFAVIPYAACIFRYKSTILLIKKISMIKIMVVVVIEHIVLLLLISLHTINDFTKTSYDIFYIKSVPEVFTIGGMGLIWLILLVIVASIIAAGINFKTKYYSKMSLLDMYRFSKFERNIKMILHTYKNLFFAIRKLSDSRIYSGEISGQAMENINSIQSISENALYGITRQMTMLSQLELDLETFDIAELIELSQEALLDKEREIIKVAYCTEETRIHSDLYCLSEAICNILKNAEDAVAEKQDPQIMIRVYYEDEWYAIEISDNGIGIDKKKIKEIFKPLVSYKMGSNNWGIGLYYSYKVINALKGHLLVQSKVGEYTKFYVYLPANIR